MDAIVSLQRAREVGGGACGASVLVHDRSPLCTLALARWLQRPVSPLLEAEVVRVVEEEVYEREVFLLRPLGFIVPSAARRIGYDESLRFGTLHEEVYREHGFTLVDVPAMPVEERAGVIDAHIRWRR